MKYRIISKFTICLVMLAFFIFLTGCGAQSKNILLTGYWPPTNQMLADFSTDKGLNGGRWQGRNFLESGYDVYAFFPVFPDGTDKNPSGCGDFMVDYQCTKRDFERITKQLRPAAIISFGAGEGPWEIEYSAVNLARWHDDYLPPKQPDASPPDKNVPAGYRRQTMLPVRQIADAVNASGLDIRAWIDRQGDPGDFLCNYMAYIAMKYEAKKSHCKAAGFIHVSADIPAAKAKKAALITLKTTIEYLNSLD